VHQREHVHTVDLSTGECTCPDRVMVGFVCKHIFRALQERGLKFTDLPQRVLDAPTLSCDWELIQRVTREHARKRKQNPTEEEEGSEEAVGGLPKFFHRQVKETVGPKSSETAAAPSSRDGVSGGEEPDHMVEEDEEEARVDDTQQRKHLNGEYKQKRKISLACMFCK
jgi:uncharacterized Zn finger protein